MKDKKNYDKVYGQPFAEYSSLEFEEFINPFLLRLERNGIQPTDLFSGRDVLDAGCGGGRGSVMIARHSPRTLVSVDISSINVDATNRRLMGEISRDSAKAVHTSLEDLPFESESFDTIWFSGVLQHTGSPSAVLGELSRVLRMGGQMYVYVYGAGGVYWRVIDAIRQGLKHESVENISSALSGNGVSRDRIAEFLDDWKVEYLRCYERQEFEEVMQEVGFSSKFLPYGTTYDTSTQRTAGVAQDLVGEGDLRFLVTKTSQPAGLSSAQSRYLDTNVMRADKFYLSDSSHENLFSSFLEGLTERIQANSVRTLREVANLQLRLRDEFLSEPNYGWLSQIAR